MLTLGLVEGILAATILLLVLVSLAEHSPLHRILGPPALLMVAAILVGVAAAELTLTIAQGAGIAAFLVLGLIAPLGYLRHAWHTMRIDERAPAPPAIPETVGAVVVAHPRRHLRRHRHAA